eukprot:tig00000114_g6033.t1
MQAFRVDARRHQRHDHARHSLRGTLQIAVALAGALAQASDAGDDSSDPDDEALEWGDCEYELGSESGRPRSKSLSSRARRDEWMPGMGAALAARIRAAAGGPESCVRGRPAALDALSEFLGSAAWKPAGAGLLLVLGEPGSGKSEIARECRRLADFAELPYLAASGDALEVPFHAFGNLLWYLVDLANSNKVRSRSSSCGETEYATDAKTEGEAKPADTTYAGGGALGGPPKSKSEIADQATPLPASATRTESVQTCASRLITAIDPALASSHNCAILTEALLLSLPEGGPNCSDRQQGESATGTSGEAALMFLGELIAAVLRGLRAILVAEDLHHMDSLSVRLIRNLALRSGTSILATSRSLHAVSEQLSALKFSPRSKTLTLSPLSPGDARQVLALQLNVKDPELIPTWLALALCTAAQGNAFAISEIAHYMVRRELLKVRGGNPWTGEGPSVEVHASVRADADKGGLSIVPDTLERLIVSRLEGLPAFVANVAKRCSVLGARFSVPLALYALAEDSEDAALIDALVQLEAAGIFRRLDMASSSAATSTGRTLLCSRSLRKFAIDRQCGYNRISLASEWRKLSGLLHVDVAAEAAYHAGAYIEAADLCQRALSVFDAERPSLPAEVQAIQDLAAARRLAILSDCHFRMGHFAAALKTGNRLLGLLGLPTADQAPVFWETGILDESSKRAILLEFLPVMFHALHNDSDPLAALYYSVKHAELAMGSSNPSHFVEGCTLMGAVTFSTGKHKQMARWFGAAEAALASGGVSLRADEIFTVDRMMASFFSADLADAERRADEAVPKVQRQRQR